MSKTANSTETSITRLNHSSQVTPLETYSHEPLNVLITRPKTKAQQLTLLLDEQGITNTSQTLFDYQACASAQEIEASLKSADIIIFISVAAVEFTHASHPLHKHLPQTIFAVGNATKQALLTLGVRNVISPTERHEHSEGLLNLPELANITGSKVLILRGDSGREHLANCLRQRGATVNYIASYQRVWRKLALNLAEQWRAQQINCIVVTSNDILLTLVNYLTRAAKATTTEAIINNYWQSQCLWLVVSERIEHKAKSLGLARVINARGASSKTLCTTLQALSCS
ncbi:MAG: uroporphyrinogen-III synthase [Colwellia sp.]